MTRRTRRSCLPGLALAVALSGCTHNHYYYTSGTPVSVTPTDSLGLSGTDPCDPVVGARTVRRSQPVIMSRAGTTVVRESSPASSRHESPVVVRRSTPMPARRARSGQRAVISQPRGGAAIAARPEDGWHPVYGPLEPEEPRFSDLGSGTTDSSVQR